MIGGKTRRCASLFYCSNYNLLIFCYKIIIVDLSKVVLKVYSVENQTKKII